MDNIYSFYRTLGITPRASGDEIKKAYRKQALQFHPDRHHNSPDMAAAFIRINNAFQVLGDPEKRRAYDSFLKFSPGVKAALPGGDFGSREKIFSHLNVLLWDIEDLLLPRNNAPPRGEQQLMEVLVFIDRWVLSPAGFKDYFMEARKQEDIRFSRYPQLFNKTGYSPFVNVSDYFYNLRRRCDRFFNKVSPGDLMAVTPHPGVSLMACLMEAQNLGIHILAFILSDRKGPCPPFAFSLPCFSDS